MIIFMARVCAAGHALLAMIAFQLHFKLILIRDDLNLIRVLN